MIRNLLGWLADVFLGPPCRRCGYRARGPRTLYAHYLRDHPEVHQQHQPSRREIV